MIDLPAVLLSKPFELEIRRIFSKVVEQTSDLAPVAGTKLMRAVGSTCSDVLKMLLQRLPIRAVLALG
jgi:hypothetical protein